MTFAAPTTDLVNIQSIQRVLKEILLHDDFDVGGFVDRQQTLNMD